jgi:hypothetical protein
VLILHAGNYEYVCLRHRETQTLYVSDILHVPCLKDPGYGKVQIGIYITALEDALERIALDSIIEGRPPTDHGAGHKDRIGNRKASVKKRSGGTSRGRLNKHKPTIDDAEVNFCIWHALQVNHPLICQWSLQQANNRNFLLLHLCYDIYHTTNPEVFHRAPVASLDSDDENASEPPPPDSVVTKDACLFLFLNSVLGQGNTGVVHGGILEIETDDKKSRLNVAAKLSFSDEQRERVHSEWSVHMHLTSQGIKGVPTLLGIFYDPEVETAPLCLLTCHAGVSLRRSGKSITSVQR